MHLVNRTRLATNLHWFDSSMGRVVVQKPEDKSLNPVWKSDILSLLQCQIDMNPLILWPVLCEWNMKPYRYTSVDYV